MVFDKAIDSDTRTQLLYYLSKKWSLETVTDSDGDGILDYLDETPAPGIPNVITSTTFSDVV